MKSCRRTPILLLCALTLCAMLCACNAAPAPLATGGNAAIAPLATSGDAVGAVEVIDVTETELPEIAHIAPEETFPVNEPTGAAGETAVSTVDELLAAIGPDRTIYIEPGTYTLTEAQDYGKKSASAFYIWEKTHDGYMLTIRDVKNLSIVGHSANDTEINTAPRYANVIGFENCSRISVRGITAGHTDGPGTCAGAVLYFTKTNDVLVTDSVLYGCGTLGLELYNCQNVQAQNCTIKECSLGAVSVVRGRNVQLENCRLRGCGSGAMPAYAMLHLQQSESVAAFGCTIEQNACENLLKSEYCRDVRLLGSAVSGNTVTVSMFSALQYSPVVEGCAFMDNAVNAWYIGEVELYPDMPKIEDVPAVSASGDALSGDDLLSMRQEDVTYVAPTAQEQPAEPAQGEMREVRAATPDEFLAAIRPNTTVYLEDGAYEFAKSSNYGAYGSAYYYWEDIFDGPGLVIDGVQNFHIVGKGADKTSIDAKALYADVIAWRDCENVSITGVTLGHSEGPGECTGGVLHFERTNTVTIRDCGLYGCGVSGVTASESRDFTIDGTEIYDCSQRAAGFWSCSDVAFTDCDIHDCGEPTFNVRDCKNVTFDGKEIENMRD